MSITWKVSRIASREVEGIRDVVTTVTVVCGWDSGDGKLQYERPITVGIKCDGVGTNPDFKDISTLQEQDVLGWVFDVLDDPESQMKAAIEQEVLTIKDARLAPKPATNPLPWQ